MDKKNTETYLFYAPKGNSLINKFKGLQQNICIGMPMILKSVDCFKKTIDNVSTGIGSRFDTVVAIKYRKKCMVLH